MTDSEIVEAFIDSVSAGVQCVIANQNMHSLYLCSECTEMMTYFANADYVHIDGMPLIWLGKLFGLALKPKYRTTHLDLLPLIAREAVERKWRVFYLGSKPGVAANGAERLRGRYPGLEIATSNGYFDTDQSGTENQAILSEIRDYRPHILLVGMGMPRQEMWVADNRKELCGCAILCCGALMDLIGGELPSAPRWLGPIGLEWLFRLVTRPHQVWRRYIIEPWVLMARLLTHYVKSGRMTIIADQDFGAREK